MGQTFAQKALARAAGLEQVEVGQIVDVRPDRILSHDNSAAILKTFRSIGGTHVVAPERLIVALDHAVPAPTAQHALNHSEIRQFVAEQQIEHFFEAGRGICHQVASEEGLVLPGQTILGADSHTTHFGWLGAFGAGIGRTEAAALWATGTLWLRVPETIRIDLSGRLAEGVTTKDLSIWLLRRLGQEAGIYRALEFGGRGLQGLSPESRMVLPNMMAESGAKNAYLTPDEIVFEWLARKWAERTGQPLEDCLVRVAAQALYPDGEAEYVVNLHVELGDLEPMVACPHSPGNSKPLSEVAGTPIQLAFVGTCTNGRLEDLAEAAAVLRDSSGKARRIARGTRLLVIPASSQVLREAISAGYVDTFLQAGAMLGTPGCGPCMGNHLGVPASGETVISTANRNFRGRMGNAESSVYLASPGVVAASAVTGAITDPRNLLGTPAAVNHSFGRSLPGRPSVQEKQLPANPESGTHRSLTTEIISGRAWAYGDDVNTDVIFPGKYTYTVLEPTDMARHALEDLDPTFAGGVQPGDVIVAGRNWGCGSSREQAVTCLLAAGVRVIVGASFARIYFRNAVNNGLLPLVCPAAAAAIRTGDIVTVDMRAHVVRSNAGIFSFQPPSESVQRIIEAGGLVALLCQSGAFVS